MLVRDLLSALLFVSITAVALYSLSGTWPPMVVPESPSMVPNINIGDVLFIQSPAYAKIITYREGREVNYKMFGDYGDVILYKPDGDSRMTPIIHRAMYWVNAGDLMPNGKIAPFAGYITKGDNNKYFDQGGLPNVRYPVKPEWVIGVAKVKVPYVGYVTLIFDWIKQWLMGR
ncbi:MAG: S26 family signal peptidase [Halobacteria archaeon]